MTSSLGNITRRKFVKKVGKGVLTAGGFAGVIGLLAKGCVYLFPKEPVSTETHIDEYSLFGGVVNLRKIEKSGNFRMNGKGVVAVKYEFNFSEPGNYLFEGWQSRYRARDKRTENFEFDIIDTPTIIVKDIHNFVDRLEASRVVDRRIQRDTLKLQYHRGFLSQQE